MDADRSTVVRAERLALASTLVAMVGWVVLLPKLLDQRPPPGRMDMLVAMLFVVVVHITALWLVAKGIPFRGWSVRGRVVILSGLFIVEIAAVVTGLLFDDPRDAWSVPASASMFAWFSDYLRMLWD